MRDPARSDSRSQRAIRPSLCRRRRGQQTGLAADFSASSFAPRRALRRVLREKSPWPPPKFLRQAAAGPPKRRTTGEAVAGGSPARPRPAKRLCRSRHGGNRATRKVYPYCSYPDPIRRGWHQGGLPSAVTMLSCADPGQGAGRLRLAARPSSATYGPRRRFPAIRPR